MEMFKKAKNGNTMTKAVIILPVLLLFLLFLSSCVKTPDNVDTDHAEESLEYTYEVYDLKRNGYKLHLDSMKMTGTQPEKNILLIHGVTYSSHEFDMKTTAWFVHLRVKGTWFGDWISQVLDSLMQ